MNIILADPAHTFACKRLNVLISDLYLLKYDLQKMLNIVLSKYINYIKIISNHLNYFLTESFDGHIYMKIWPRLNLLSVIRFISILFIK